MYSITSVSDSAKHSTPIRSEDWVDVPSRFLVGLNGSPKSLNGKVKNVTVSKTTIKVALIASAVITSSLVVGTIGFLSAGLFLAAGAALFLLAINHFSFMKLGTSL